MIYHISIAATNPLHVAQVLAELWRGQVMPFPDDEDSYVALSLDAYGTLIVVHPRQLELVPGSNGKGVQHRKTSPSSTYSAFHAAVSVPISEAEIRSIADREGWRVSHSNRGEYFDLIELWVENHQLLELFPPEIEADYLAALKQFLATTTSTSTAKAHS